MNSNFKFFKNSEFLPVDQFFHNVLYDKKYGYYNSKQPFGKSGDFITAPKISNLFSEMIAIWIISTWELFGKPKKINVVELGPGDGSLTKVLLEVFRKFPRFNASKKIYLYEMSNLLRKVQKKNIINKEVKWINSLDNIKEGPVIFFGNEFFDAIPIKQLKFQNNFYYEKYYTRKFNSKIKVIFKKVITSDIKMIKSFKTLKNQKFIEFPKKGLEILEKIIKKILKLRGCILMIDYGYLKSKNLDTIQSVKNHKKNNVLKNLGKADVTSQVNFSLLKEFFKKKKLRVKNTISQKEFLEKMGILDRAEILSKKMNFSEKTNLYLRLKRLLGKNLMGDLFKVILAYKFKNDKFLGFK